MPPIHLPTRRVWWADVPVTASMYCRHLNCGRYWRAAEIFTDEEIAVLCALTSHQPINRTGLADTFGKEINRDLIGSLRYKNIVGNSPKARKRERRIRL